MTGTDAGAPPPQPDSDELSTGARRGRRGRGTMRRTPDRPCLNCGDATPGSYCRNCGQAKRLVAVSVGALIMDALEDQLILSKALPRTLLYLLVRPGFLTVEYVNGRIVRYIAPFRLYLATSVVFFLLVSFFGLRALESGLSIDSETALDSADVATKMAALQEVDTIGLPPEARAALRQVFDVAPRLQDAASNAGRADSLVDNLRLPGIQPWAQAMRDGEYSPVVRRMVDRAVTRFGHLPPREAFRAFSREYLEYAPHMVFLLLPLFALILKLLYVRRNRFYAEHFVFALHVHALTFLVFILMFLIGRGSVNSWLFFGLMIYVWLALKRVYGQGFFRTTAKYCVLGILYMMLLSVAMIGPAIVALAA